MSAALAKERSETDQEIRFRYSLGTWLDTQPGLILMPWVWFLLLVPDPHDQGPAIWLPLGLACVALMFSLGFFSKQLDRPQPRRVVTTGVDVQRASLHGDDSHFVLPDLLRTVEGKLVKVPPHWVGRRVPRPAGLVLVEVSLISRTIVRIGDLAIAKSSEWLCHVKRREHRNLAVVNMLVCLAILVGIGPELRASRHLLLDPMTSWSVTPLADLHAHPPAKGGLVRIQATLQCDTEALLASTLLEVPQAGTECMRLRPAKEALPIWLLLNEPVPPFDPTGGMPVGDGGQNSTAVEVSFLARIAEVETSKHRQRLFYLDTRVLPWFTTARWLHLLALAGSATAALLHGALALWWAQRRLSPKYAEA